jgi:hypothetical protein
LKSRCYHRFPLALLALSTAAFTGCSGDEVPPIETPRPVVTLTSGAFSVRVDPDAGDLALRRRAEIQLRSPRGGLELGKVTALDDAANTAGSSSRGGRAPSSAG